MRIRVNPGEFSRPKAELAVCFAYEKDREPRGVDDPAVKTALARRMKAERFGGLSSDLLIWNSDGVHEAVRYLVVGLGRPSESPGEAIRTGCARAIREASRFAARSLVFRLPDCGDHAAEEVRAAVEGTILGAYHFDRHLTDKIRRIVKPDRVTFDADGPRSSLARAARLGEAAAAAVCAARDLVNEGPSRKAPAALARLMTRGARAAGLTCKVLGPADLRRLGMTSLLAVSRGSQEPPRVVHLTYRPKGRSVRNRPKIVLVGKGVTFDSGGLNLKLGDSMLTMKSDMAGAATVLATMTALASVGCRAEVHGLLGLVENMTGAAAYKPGDILNTYSGKTVEVGNTDAEGRLVLCDLLAYAADRLKPTHLVDVATLTGACVVALGTLATGVFTRHDPLRDGLLTAAHTAGEKMWPLPMYEEYLQLLQKGPADLVNVGGRWGGATTAALFLGEFVPRTLSWAHLDIAGPAFTETDLPEARIGATGAGVRTLIRWLESV